MIDRDAAGGAGDGAGEGIGAGDSLAAGGLESHSIREGVDAVVTVFHYTTLFRSSLAIGADEVDDSRVTGVGVAVGVEGRDRDAGSITGRDAADGRVHGVVSG